jgi:hypothetical protein
LSAPWRAAGTRTQQLAAPGRMGRVLCTQAWGWESEG